jgi:uncharacterized membrane protein YiaA
MVQKLDQNPTIQLFATNHLKKDKKFTNDTMILVCNYSFLIRIIVIHLLLLGLPFKPTFQLTLLIILEITYFISSSGQHLSKKHIRALILIIPRIWQSLFLVTV